MKLILKPNEMIIRAGNSDLLWNGHKVTGKLIVTNQRIYFRTMCAEDIEYNREIVANEISELHYFNTRRIFPNGMNIKTKNGEEILFKVNNRSEWAKIIIKMY